MVYLVQGFHKPLNNREDAFSFVKHVEHVSNSMLMEIASLGNDLGGLIAHLNFFNFWTLFKNYKHRVQSESPHPNPCSFGAQFVLKFIVERTIASIEKFFIFSCCSGISMPKPLAHALFSLMSEIKKRCSGPWRNIGTGRRYIMALGENAINCASYLVKSGQMDLKGRAFCKLIFAYPSTKSMFLPMYKACETMRAPSETAFSKGSGKKKRLRTPNPISKGKRKFCARMLLDSFAHDWTQSQPDDLSDLLENPREILNSKPKFTVSAPQVDDRFRGVDDRPSMPSSPSPPHPFGHPVPSSSSSSDEEVDQQCASQNRSFFVAPQQMQEGTDTDSDTVESSTEIVAPPKIPEVCSKTGERPGITLPPSYWAEMTPQPSSSQASARTPHVQSVIPESLALASNGPGLQVLTGQAQCRPVKLVFVPAPVPPKDIVLASLQAADISQSTASQGGPYEGAVENPNYGATSPQDGKRKRSTEKKKCLKKIKGDKQPKPPNAGEEIRVTLGVLRKGKKPKSIKLRNVDNIGGSTSDKRSLTLSEKGRSSSVAQEPPGCSQKPQAHSPENTVPPSEKTQLRTSKEELVNATTWVQEFMNEDLDPALDQELLQTIIDDLFAGDTERGNAQDVNTNYEGSSEVSSHGNPNAQIVPNPGLDKAFENSFQLHQLHLGDELLLENWLPE